ncbi:MAG: hypothetical protein HXK71_06010 [Clostridiales bacterium]|nr:hypothetical protein [Clostridiales bacterium]
MKKSIDIIIDDLLKKFEISKRYGGLGGLKTKESTEIINDEMREVLKSVSDIKIFAKQYIKVKALKEQTIADNTTASLKLTIIALLISALSVAASLISILRTNNFQFANYVVIAVMVLLVGLLLKQWCSIKKRPDNYIYNLSYLENLLKAKIDELSVKI